MRIAEQVTISHHEALVAAALAGSPDDWTAHPDLYERLAGQVSPRTVRHHVKRLVDLGLVDVIRTFPLHRYRWSDHANVRNHAYLTRLYEAASAMGIAIPVKVTV